MLIFSFSSKAFYTRMLKDMLREDVKILANDYTRYHYTMKWFLEYYGYEQKSIMQRNEDDLDLPGLENDHDTKDYDFSLVASALDLKAVLFCLKQMRIAMDNKQWFELQMTMDCLRQMLQTISVMVNSETEEYRIIAEHIQSNLYYEQQHLDLLIETVRCYKNQSNGYLKSVVLLNHVLLRSLDKYQQGKKVMFTRKKARSKAKKVKPGQQEEEPLIADFEESENEDVTRDSNAAYKDQVFKFDSFEKVTIYIYKHMIRSSFAYTVFMLSLCYVALYVFRSCLYLLRIVRKLRRFGTQIYGMYYQYVS